ncbi:MAG: hypothetical protein Q9214_007221, partial [Letrouitia sp. 1 TL-2023]
VRRSDYGLGALNQRHLNNRQFLHVSNTPFNHSHNRPRTLQKITPAHERKKKWGKKGKTRSMSPAHRKSSRAQRSSQSTLSFGGRANTNNKITKPSVPPPSSAKKQTVRSQKDEGQEETVKREDVVVPGDEDEDEDEPATAAVESVPESKELAQGRKMAIREAKAQAQENKNGAREDEAEEQARKVSEAAVRRYWTAEEEGRKAPRVHQQALSMHEKILRHFDLSSQYGPCVGIPRVRRWKRAETLGLRPPIEVLAVLVREREREEDGAKKKRNSNSNKKGMDTAFMDELLGGASLGA